MKTKDDIKKIISASLATYEIGKPGKNPISSSDIGQPVCFISEPKTFVAGDDSIDACYVGETNDAIILAFRGTIGLPTNPAGVLDWMNNFEADTVKIDGILGKVHKGFAESIQRLREVDGGFQKELKELKNKNRHKDIIITGYSKGAALAPLAAAFMNSLDGLFMFKKPVIRIFEPPRCGNFTFATYFNLTFNDTHRYEYQDDIVPHVPPIGPAIDKLEKIEKVKEILDKYYDNPEEWNYTPVGKLFFVNWEDKVEEHGLINPLLLAERIMELKKAFDLTDLSKLPTKPLTDHLPKPLIEDNLFNKHNKHLYKALTGDDMPEIQRLNLNATA